MSIDAFELQSFELRSFQSLDEALSREWLDPNGLGGYASSTVTGTNTRRYHGLLVAALNPPVERTVLWSRTEEEVRTAHGSFELGTNVYPGAVHPRGFELQRAFSLFLAPTTRYGSEDWEIERTVLMVQGKNTTCVRYRNTGAEAFTLRLRPLMAFRDFHATARANDAAHLGYEETDTRLAVRPYATMPSLWFHHSGGSVIPSPLWYYRFQYVRERERGFEEDEDLFSAFVLEVYLEPGASAWLVGSTESGPLDPRELERAELERRTRRAVATDGLSPELRALHLAADSFIVRRGEAGRTILAGYHWFSDWGRDAMIALPGLALARGQVELAAEVLRSFIPHLSQGMLPNRFPDDGAEPEYNTVDAALWFVHAAHRCALHPKADAGLRVELFSAIRQVLEGYTQGARYGIRQDVDGLITAGESGQQLTWMDARVGDYVVTPRRGKPVEINALWYHALLCAAEMAGEGEEALVWRQRAAGVKKAFNRLFWNAEQECLYDVIGDGGPDTSIRPNQIFAVSLRPDLLSQARARKVLACVREFLLTPYGLRSLSARSPEYRGSYRGDVWERDTAYHQGTVWGWLIGPYVDALVRVRGLTGPTRAEIEGLLQPLLQHVHAAGLGSLSEIFDADPPHRPGGCVSQAWSVGEVLRVAIEYLGIRPA
jgi:predicted glycogen debranching enzyme